MSRPEPEVIRTIPDPPAAPSEPLLTVRVLQAPVRVWERASVHTAELMREFALLLIGADSGTSNRELPGRLSALIADLRARYAGTSEAQARELEQAVLAGERTHDFTYEVPAGVAEACLTLLHLLDEADRFCAEGTSLITLVSPPDQRAFRSWYLGEFVRQVAGEEPLPWSGPTD